MYSITTDLLRAVLAGPAVGASAHVVGLAGAALLAHGPVLARLGAARVHERALRAAVAAPAHAAARTQRRVNNMHSTASVA